MTTTNASLTRAAGACAAIAGAIFIAVQIKHPAMNVSSVTSANWQIRSIAKFVMCGLAITGLTGMYLHQRRRVGALGTIGYVVFVAGYLMMSSVEAIAAFVLPGLSHSSPGYVNDVIRASIGQQPAGDIGSLQTLFTLAGLGYMAGGLLFGIALFRARVLARWAAALLAVATVSTAALAALPTSFNRPFAVPAGVALIGLGVSLWRTQRTGSPTTAPAAVPQVRAAVHH